MRVGPSKLCDRGVFASRAYEPGEIIETCPFIEVPVDEVPGMIDYVYEGDDDTLVVVVFGCGMLYNHASPGNVTYHRREDPDCFVFSAIAPIAEGDELSHDYGAEWWASRDQRPAQLTQGMNPAARQTARAHALAAAASRMLLPLSGLGRLFGRRIRTAFGR